MGRKLQNPDSWFHTARVGAGYKTVRSLAERIGVALSQVVEWGRGPQQPMWQHIPKLAEAFGLGIPEVITGVWQESVGDFCPCGCGGQKILPENPTARQLLIEVPCANCGETRTHIQGNWRFHFKLCLKCAGAARRGERVEFTCVGFNDYHTRRWAKKCPGKIQLLPYQIRRHQKDQQKPVRPFKRQRAFINKSKKTFRCGSCARAAMILAVTEARVEAVMKSTDKTVPKIRSQLQRGLMLSKHIREVNPNFLNAAPTVPKNPHRSEAACRSLTISNIVKGWSKKLPSSIHMGVCLVCGKLTFETKRPANFHRPHYRAWSRTPEGRSYQRTRGPKPPLRQAKPGAPKLEENLRIHCYRAIQHYLARKSFDEIARAENLRRGNNLTRQSIEKSVKSLIADLPSLQLVPKRFRRLVELLIETSGTVSAAPQSTSAMNG